MQACAKSERQVRSCYHLQYLEEKEEGGKKKTYKTNTTVCHVTKATGFLFWSALDCVYKLLPTAKSF